MLVPYRSYCLACKEEYTWKGLLTGVGKSNNEIKDMKKKWTVCHKCNAEGLKTEPDMGVGIGKKYEAKR